MSTFEPIAVVGQSCLLPGCLSPEQLWDTVIHGRVQLTEASETQWDPMRHRTDEEILAYAGTRQGGFVKGFDSLAKPSVFGLENLWLTDLDPVFKWSLFVAADALHQSGCSRGRVLERTGIVLGNLSYPTRSIRVWFEETHLMDLFPEHRRAAPRTDPRNRFMSGLPAHLIRRALGLGGEVFALDAACASGLYAIKLACDSLREQRADLMLAAGVNAVDPLFLNAGFRAVHAISRTGQSRPFHEAADGLIPANGAACVVLKRLADALRDGDTVLGVLRGIGLSNDGRTGSFVSPSERGQIRCMRSAFEQSGLSPSQVSLVECHATGTIHGDRTEIFSMRKVFDRADPLVIGSLKANLGHTITVAGIAGLIKVLACMAHETLPPTPNAFPLQSVLQNSSFRVLGEAEPWTSSPRVACVSAFGFGGNNAHLIVEAWRPGLTVGPLSGGPPADHRAVAVVGLAVRMPGIAHTSDLVDFLLTGNLNPAANMTRANLSLAKPAFPPKDLEQTLGQQLLMLELTAQALFGVKKIDPTHTGVFIGMGIDAEVNRFAFKWRIRDLLPDAAAYSADWLAALEKTISRGLTAESLIGNMPNIPANRINNQYDFQGPGFTVSSEECSGDQALALAAKAIGRGEIQTAVVGAVDFSDEKTHDRAVRALGVVGPGHKSCDGGVVLILKDKSLALSDGDPVWATIGAETGSGYAWGNSAHGSRVRRLVGHSHAASGLLHITAAVLLAAHRVAPGTEPDDFPVPIVRPRRPLGYNVVNTSFSGVSVRTYISAAPQVGHPAMTLHKLPGFWMYAAPDKDGLLAALQADRPTASGPCRMAFYCSEKAKPRILAKAVERLSQSRIQDGWHPDGFAFFSGPVGGDMAFVYTGAASAYAGMGKSLLFVFPWLLEGLNNKLRNSGFDFGWIYDERDARNKEPYFQLIGASLLSQVHTLFSREVAGLAPQALIGLSAGETNALFAFDIWRDMDALLEQLASGSGTYDRYLGGRFEAVARFWGLDPEVRVRWENWRLFADIEAVKAAVAREERVYLTIIYSGRDCMIGGDPQGCARLIEKIGKSQAVFLDNAFAIHCPPASAFAQTWRRLHTRATFPASGIRFYSNHCGAAIEPTSESLAEALTGQAVDTIDFPRLIERAWKDGVRIFIEHGPRDSLSVAIGQILKGKPHLAVAWDKFGQAASDQAWRTLCTLWCAGIEVDWTALRSGMGPDGHDAASHRSPFEFLLHQPAIVLPPVETQPAVGEQLRALSKAAGQAPVSDSVNPWPGPVARGESPDNAFAWQEFHSRLLLQHQAYLGRQQEAFAATLGLIHRAWDHFLGGKDVPPASGAGAVGASSGSEGLSAQQPGLKLNRAQLEILAEGAISEVLGPAFKAQDSYGVQVRLPGPPLLLADRITGIEGEACGLGKGRIWSETDVTADAWYLHHGRMPAGIFVESGQADLLLVSWLGADLLNRGERAYRLLGCELTYYGGLPRPGEVLNYEIRITGYARQGDIRLFFFENDCWIDGQRRLSVRNGQAGFFTAQELEASGGALWDPETAPYRETPRLDIPEAHTWKNSFSQQDVAAYLSGDMTACFGDTHRWTAAHTRTPRSQGSTMNFIGEISAFEVRGGPAGRGYLRSETDLDAQAWYFRAHFKNDPCMPGTLMAEAGLQLMAFYAVGLGLTCQRDGWRFEPADSVTFKFVCRGQIVPDSRKMTYELFVDDVADEPCPLLTAHLLCSVDGVKAFLCERMVLKLVPDWPLATLPELLLEPVRPGRRTEPVAQLEGFKFDYRALIHSALGQPSLAFGFRFEPYDHEVRPMRLPGPPYHFMSRVVSLEAEFGKSAGHPTAVVVYDFPPDAWYFRESGNGQMPFSVLMEVALQPCGWLAAFTHAPELIGTELLFRNLDGWAVTGRPVVPKDQSIRTRTTLLEAFGSKDIIIKKFRVVSEVGGEKVFEMTTTFGFFPPQAMDRQRGLSPSPTILESYRHTGGTVFDITERRRMSPGPAPATMPTGRLLMIDRIVYLDPQGGRAGQGVVKAEKDVDPGEWFFKAHFFQDPVQPGSLGIEAILQTLQFYMLHQEFQQDLPDPHFEPVLGGREIEWHYRGQVTPGSRLITITADILEQARGDYGAMVAAEAALWVDGLMIYHVPKIGMKLSI